MESVKLYVGGKNDSQVLPLLLLADLSGVTLELIENGDKANNTLFGRLPYGQTADGTILGEGSSLARYIARANPDAGLLGKNAFESALVNQWVAWGQSSMMDDLHKVILPLLGVIPFFNPAKYADGLKGVKECAKVLDSALNDKQWLVGDSLTYADIYIASLFQLLFQTVLDAGFRKAMPNLASWFERFIALPAVVKRFGNIQLSA
jgi:elongation factor 1-gamma